MDMRFGQNGAHIMMTSSQQSFGGGNPNVTYGVSQRQHYADRLEALEQELLHIKHSPHSARGPAAADMGAFGNVPPGVQLVSNRPLASIGSSVVGQPLMLDGTCAGVPQLQLQNGAMGGWSVPGSARSAEHAELLSAHKNVLEVLSETTKRHNDLMKAHSDLMKQHTALLSGKQKKKAAQHPALGVIRLDYNYPPAAGDTDCPASYGYDVFFRAVPGLTFERAQAGRFGETVERDFAEAIKFLEQRGVSAICGDCGFMMAFQVLARKIASKPVFMSSMVQCPMIAAAFDPSDQILILTANGESLKPQKEVLLSSCGFDVEENRFIIKGCQHVPGFDAVAKGEAVDVEKVQPGVVKVAQAEIQCNPNIRAILLECTELPPYADALRYKTGLPVFDVITAADFYVSAFKDNPRFGVNDWQEAWDEEQDEYSYGQNLIEADRAQLVNKIAKTKAKAKAKSDPKKMKKMAKQKKALQKAQAPTLGIIRLDYNYPPAAGDIDCPGSYDYDVLFRVVPGMTFEMAQSGKLSPQVRGEFVQAVKWLEGKGCCGITGDCGFMMAFQPLARQTANIPVFMSSMVQCPMISVAFDKYDKILILTANSATLKPQKATLLSQCGFDVDDDRFVIYGCQTVPGFDAVAKGEAVDVEYVTPGVVKMVKDILNKIPTIKAICLECTELPPYSDALRFHTKLPVFDAITCADFFVSARKDNPRFGMNQWQADWDGDQDEYEFGQHLTEEQRKRAINV